MNGILNRAMLEKAPIEIIYMSKSGILTQRLIRVLDVNENTITAFCMLRNRKRTFRLDNILSAATPKRNKYIEYSA